MAPGRLAILAYLQSEGRRTNGQLARYANLTPATISVMLEQLMDQGLVERRQDEGDRRSWWVSLTAKGEEEIREIEREWDQHYTEAFADYSDEELRTAHRVLETIVDVYDSF